jgi:glycosyltransferase involved in cell wall biosynthesis
MRPLRVLIVIPNLEYGGANQQAILLTMALPRERFMVRVVALGQPGPLVVPLRARGIEIETLGTNRLLDAAPLLRLRRLIRGFQPDVIHAWQVPSLRALALAGRRGARLLVSAVPASQRPGMFNRLDEWLLRQTDRVTATSPAEAAAHYGTGLPDDAVVVIPPAVAPSAETHSAANALALPRGARVLLCVGPLERGKGYYEAIWSFGILHYLYEDLHLVIVGDGPDRLRLEEFGRTVEGHEAIHFLGRQPHLAALLEQSEIVWALGPIPGVNVALEAMAAGRPVVASRLASLAELVVDGESGFLVPPGEPALAARKTRQLLDDTVLRHRFGALGRQRAEQRFALTHLVQRYASLYEAA